MAGAWLDTLLDRSIIGGYTSLGYRLRSASWGSTALPRLDGRVVVITGATAGIGLAAAERFAALGADVRLLARSAERGEAARARIAERTGNTDVTVHICDLSIVASVQACAGELAGIVPQIDVLVNNAGVLTARRTMTREGVELTFATNVLGPFALTQALVPLMAGGGPSRVINVSSGGMYGQKLNVDELQMEHGTFDGVAAYARTKRAEVVLTEMWAEHLSGVGIVVHAMHPGWVDTPGVQSSLPRFRAITRPLLRTPEQGADTIVWLGAAHLPGESSGGFWHDRRRRPTHLVPWTRERPGDRERLWRECVRLSGRH